MTQRPRQGGRDSPGTHEKIISDDCTLDSTEDIPVPLTAKRLHQGKWHTADDLYHIITNSKDVNEDVPPVDKSKCYLLVNNQRNMSRLASGNNKKCDFYDDCGTWDHSKGNTCKTTFVETDGSLRHVELKKNFYSTKVRCQGKVHWVPFEPQSEDENVLSCTYFRL